MISIRRKQKTEIQKRGRKKDEIETKRERYGGIERDRMVVREIEYLRKIKKDHCLGFKMYCGESKREFRWVYIYGLHAIEI